MFDQQKIGLVLSGGGAKGAYQVGVIKALAELNVPIQCVSGASIGALNGAIIAAASDLNEAGQQLEKLWQALAEKSPVEVNTIAISKKLLSVGSSLFIPGGVPARLATALVAVSLDDNEGIANEEPLYQLIDQYFSIERLEKGLDLYASLFKSRGALMDIGQVLLAATNIKETPNADFFHIQSLPKEQQVSALLASAAIPLAFAPKEVANEHYSDGGQGGWNTAQGNTPIEPLIRQAHCDLIIVTHLSDGALWNKRDYPNSTILEIRPQHPIAKSKINLMDLFDFSENSINEWIQQGYQDTLRCIGRVTNALDSHKKLGNARKVCEESFSRNAESDARLTEAMNRLKK